jgi:hypothetical protein
MAIRILERDLHGDIQQIALLTEAILDRRQQGGRLFQGARQIVKIIVVGIPRMRVSPRKASEREGVVP